MQQNKEKRPINLKTEQQKSPNSNNREKINRKNGRASEIYGMVTKDLASVLLESKKERRNISRPKMYAKK